MQICIERIGENTILMHFHAIVSDIRSYGDDFPAVWNYGKFSAKFLVSSVKVIKICWDFCRSFKVLLEELSKFLVSPK